MRRPRPGRPGDPVVAATLVLTTAAAAAGFVRIFRGHDFLPKLLLLALVAHWVAAVSRRRLPGLVADAATLVVSAWAAVALIVPAALSPLGLPSPRTPGVVAHEVSSAWGHFSTEATPTPVRTGYLLLAAAGVVLCAWAADRLAFRYRTPAEAVMPSATLFVFATLLTGPSYRIASTVAYGIAVALYALTVQVARRRATPTVAAWRVAAGGAVAALLFAGSAVAVETVPGAAGKGVVDVRRLGADTGGRTVVSPLVDIRRRLLDQTDLQLLTVTSSRPTYWRLMALDDFDGTVWSSSQSFQGAGRNLRQPPAGKLPTVTVTQHFRIGSLDQPWAPAAFEARGVTDDGGNLLWDSASATLIVRRSRQSISGLSYTVRSQVPAATAEQLRTVRGTVPSGIATRDRLLPVGFPDEVARTARAVTRGAATDYDKARMLQDWLRTFTYSTDVASGESSQAIIDFLHSQKGYCEQFAGTFAAMARTLGLPARVVVGFTTGDADPASPGTYRVFGRDAHAWPEVYLAGAGWVPFEPTPGRGDTQTSSFTGAAGQQAGPGGATAPPAVAPPTSVAGSPGQVAPGGPSTTLAGPAATPSPSPTATTGPGPGRGLFAGLAVVALLLAAPLAGALAVRLRRRRRHRAARSPAAQVAAHWSDVVDAAATIDMRPAPADTYLDWAAELGGELHEPGARAALLDLARARTIAAWQPQDLAAADAVAAGGDAAAVLAQVSAQASRRRRVAAWVGVQSSWWKRSRTRAWPVLR